jgi:hypothetical protein
MFDYGKVVLGHIAGHIPEEPPGPGPRPPFSLELFRKSMESGDRCLGTANNLVCLDLQRPAVTNSLCTVGEVLQYADAHWSVEEAFRQGGFTWRHPVAVACCSRLSPTGPAHILPLAASQTTLPQLLPQATQLLQLLQLPIDAHGVQICAKSEFSPRSFHRQLTYADVC